MDVADPAVAAEAGALAVPPKARLTETEIAEVLAQRRILLEELLLILADRRLRGLEHRRHLRLEHSDHCRLAGAGPPDAAAVAEAEAVICSPRCRIVFIFWKNVVLNRCRRA